MSADVSRVADEDFAAAGDVLVPLLEEEVRVEKQAVTTGKVRIQTVVETVQENARAILEGERVEITRVAIDRVVESAPQLRTEDGVTIVPIVEEVLFVEKKLVLKEELHIRRYATSETVDVPVMLKKQRAEITRVDGDDHVKPNEENAL